MEHAPHHVLLARFVRGLWLLNSCSPAPRHVLCNVIFRNAAWRAGTATDGAAMRPRRSRIQRIYRHLTRRAPNRAAQWVQIAGLRSQGKPGHVSPVQRQRVFVSDDLSEIAFESAE